MVGRGWKLGRQGTRAHHEAGRSLVRGGGPCWLGISDHHHHHHHTSSSYEAHAQFSKCLLFFLSVQIQRIYRFSFKTQTKINYECSTVHYHSKGGSLDAELEMRGNVFFFLMKIRDVLREIAWGFAIRSFVYNVVLLLLYLLRGRVGPEGLKA